MAVCPCEPLLAELGERQERAELEAHEALRVRWSGIERRVLYVLALAVADIPRGVHDAAEWWCRTARCEPELTGMAGALRDATRERSRTAAALHAAPARSPSNVATCGKRSAE